MHQHTTPGQVSLRESAVSAGSSAQPCGHDRNIHTWFTAFARWAVHHYRAEKLGILHILHHASIAHQLTIRELPTSNALA